LKTKHIFVPALDVGELLPFVVRKTKNLQENMKEQERAKKELVRFVDLLQKNLKEPIWYMGMDVIEEKSYERFIFEKGGFFELMIEEPLAMNAHFVHKKRAQAFCKALKKTFKKIMGPSPVRDMFIDSIKIQDEKDTSLTYERWDQMKELRNM